MALSNNKIKEIRSLQHKKYRQKYDKFVVEGYKSCIEFIRSGKFNIIQIFIIHSDNKKYIIPETIGSAEVIPITQAEMKKISMLKTPSDMLMVCQKPKVPVNLQLNDFPHILYLDRIQDPGNLGTIIRIADWFGLGLILLSEGSADVYNPKVVQASMGSLSNVVCVQKEMDDVVSKAPDHTIIGTDMGGELLDDFTWPKNVILIIGNEGTGINTNLNVHIEKYVGIKGHPDRVAESLNAANATAILTFSMLSK